MTQIYAKEQLQNMDSSKLIDIILELQKELNIQYQTHQLSIKHLQLGFKEQVQAQKEMIKNLLQSEKSLNIQLEKQLEVQSQLKFKLDHEINQVDVKINDQIKPNAYQTFSEANKQVQKEVKQNDDKNNSIFKEEQTKKHFGYISNAFSQSKETTPSNKIKSQNQFLKFSQKSNQLISQFRTPICSNAYLYKSIQSSNYIINVPSVENIIENNIQSLIDTPELINNNEQNETEQYILENTQYTKQNIQIPSKHVIDKNSINNQSYQQNSKRKLSSLTMMQNHETSPQAYTNVNLKIVNSINKEDQNHQAPKFGVTKRNDKITPFFERRKSHQSFINSLSGLDRSQFTSNNLFHQQFSMGSQNNIQACQNPSSRNINQQNIKLGDLIFEDFFIIGPSISEMEETAQNYSDIMNGTVQPEIYVSFPGQQGTNDQNQRQSIKNFCYPFNVEFNKQFINDLKKSKVDDILNLQIFKPNFSQISPNTFVFSMLGETERCQDKSILNPILVESNPHLSLYCVCFRTENFLTVPKTKGGLKEEEDCIYLVPITYCFLTYYPFINYFLDVISEIANQSKITRCTEYIKLLTEIDEQKCQYCKQNKNSVNGQKRLSSTQQTASIQSMNSVTNLKQSYQSQSGGSNQICTCQQNQILCKILKLDIQNEIKTFNSHQFEKIREALRNSQIQKPHYDLDLKFKYKIDEQLIYKNYKVPDQNNIKYVESEWGAYITISCLSLEDFLFIFTAVALEKMIIFFSKNISLLTSCIFTFYSMLKPFNYVLPVIFSVPEDLLNLIESPVPLILGINKDISFKTELENNNFDFNSKIVVDLDSSSILCEPSQLQKQIEKSMPLFKRNQNEIVKNYFEINPRPSNQIKLFNSYRKKKYSQSLKNIKSSDLLLNEVYPTQYNQMRTFLEIIGMCMDNYFIKNLHPSTNQLINELKYQEIQNIIVKKNKEDCEFIKEFTKTQTFTSYLESLYITPK